MPWDRPFASFGSASLHLQNPASVCLFFSIFLKSVPFWAVLGRFVSEIGAGQRSNRPSSVPATRQFPICCPLKSGQLFLFSGPFWAVLGHWGPLHAGPCARGLPLLMIGLGWPPQPQDMSQRQGLTRSPEPAEGPKAFPLYSVTGREGDSRDGI